MGKQAQDVLRTELERIYSGDIGKQSKRAARRIANIFEKAPRGERSRIFQKLCKYIEKDYLAPGKRRRGRDTFKLLGASLGEFGLASGDMDFLLLLASHKAKDLAAVLFSGHNVIVIAFYHYLEGNAEASLRFCQLLFQEHARKVEDYDKRVLCGKVNPDEGDVDQVSGITTILLQAAAAMCTTDTPQKGWLLRIIELADGSRKDAKQVLFHILEILEFCSLGQNRKLQILTQEDLDAQNGEDGGDEFNLRYLQPPQNVCLVIPQSHAHVIGDIVRKSKEKTAKDLVEIERFGEWFITNSNRLAQIFDDRQQEVLERPKYGIRPYGYDSALVQVSPLSCVGIRSFALHSEGEHFPDVKLEIQVVKSTAGLCSLWAEFRDFNLICSDHLLDNWQGLDQNFLRAVFEYIILDAFYNIVCRVPRKNLEGESVTRGKMAEERAMKRVQVVRPFLRRLPEGFRATDQARKLAYLHQGWHLPDGITFVQSHARWQGLPEGKPAPLFTYTDEMLMQSIL